MPTWNKRGLRGSILEEIVNRTNLFYKDSNLALIQKIPTPIIPVEYAKETHQIKLAYFEKKSTVDYIGAVQGIPVCFDAKECNSDRFRLNNIHTHQFEFMKCFEEQEGVAFVLIYFTSIEKFYYMRFKELEFIYKRYQNGEIKSFKIDELDEEFFLKYNSLGYIEYLEGISKDLSKR